MGIIMKKFSQTVVSKGKKDKVIKEAKDHIKKWKSYYNDNNEYFKNMVDFINGEQWERDAKVDYQNAGKVMLTFNKIRPYVRQLIGDDKKITVDIKLRNVGANNAKDGEEKATQEKESLLRGLLRNIAYHSNSLRIYNNAYTDSVEGGYGSWRVIVAKDKTENVLRIETVLNPLNCYWDVGAKDTCKTDGNYCGIVTYITKEEFKNRYPKFEYPDEFTSADDYALSWGDEKKIAICEEYRTDQYKEKIFVMQDGSTVPEAQVLENPEMIEQVKEEKTLTKTRVLHYKFTDQHLLEKSETPFDELPILFVPGYIRTINKKEKIFSFVDDARDAQRLLNFIGSEIAEWLKLTKKTKFMVPAAMIDKYINDWNNPDQASTALRYDPHVAPGYKPETITPPAMPADLVSQFQRAEMDIQIALGRYEANIGQASNEKSGLAIFNRALEGNANLEEFRDNRNYAIAKTGKIILNAIPKVYDTPRSVNITDNKGEDNSSQINQVQFDPMKMQSQMQPTFKENSYSVEISVGPSFAMQKQNTAKMTLELIRADPTGKAYGLLAEKVAENLDVNNSYQIAARLRTLVDPSILQQEEDPMAAKQAQQQAQQQQQQQQQLQQEMQSLQLKNAQTDITTKIQKMMDSHSDAMSNHIKAMAEAFEAHTQRLMAAAKAKVEEDRSAAETIKAHSDVVKTQIQLETQALKSREV